MQKQGSQVTGKQGMQSWIKGLLGCAVGCGVIVLLAFLVAVGGVYWILSPGEQMPTDRIVGKETVAVLRLDNPADDEGMLAMISGLLLELQGAERRAQREQMPESLRWLEPLQELQQQRNVQGFKMYLPREATATFELIPDNPEPQFVLAVNLRMFPRLIKQFVSLAAADDSSEVRAVGDGGREYQVFQDGSAVAFVGGTLIWAQESDVMPRVLGRIDDDGERRGASPAILRAYGKMDDRWDLYGVVENRDDALVWFLQRVLEVRSAPPTEEVVVPADLAGMLRATDGIRFGIDVVSDDAIEGRFGLECGSEADVESWLPRVRDGFESVASEAEGAGLDFEVAVRREKNAVHADFRVSGIHGAILEHAGAVQETTGE